MQKRKEIKRVPIKYREKFLEALADEHLKGFTDQQKIEYANRAMRYDCLNEFRIYESNSIMDKLVKHCPNLVNEWNDTVKNYGENY